MFDIFETFSEPSLTSRLGLYSVAMTGMEGQKNRNVDNVPTITTLIMAFTYVIEHMEDDEQTPSAVPPWVMLEYAVRKKTEYYIG